MYILAITLLTCLTFGVIVMSEPALQSVPQFDKLEVVKAGTISLTKNASSSSATSTTAHGLGYQPIILAYSQNAAGVAYVPLQYYFVNLSSGLVDYEYAISVDNTNIYLFIGAPNYGTNTYYTATWTVTIKYYLLRQTVN